MSAVISNKLAPKSMNYLVTIKRDKNIPSNDWASIISNTIGEFQ